MFKININNKKILVDIILNLIASIIPVMILQFIILPLIAKGSSVESYGFLIFFMTLMNFMGSTFGNSLNNTRLVNDKNIGKKDESNYNFILLIYILFSIVLSFTILFFQQNDSFLTYVVISLIIGFVVFKNYGLVDYRIKLDYKKILILNTILVMGYGLGFLIYLLNNSWKLIFLISYLLVGIYILISTTVILKGGIRTNEKIGETIKSSFVFMLSSLLISIIVYVDKLLLYPMMGATTLSIYYVSTLIGKTLELGINPINSVLLSYFSKMSEFKKKYFLYYFLSLSVIGLIGYIVLIVISRPVLTVMYPQFIDEVVYLIPITTATVVFTVIANMLNAVNLNFKKTSYQVYVNVIHVVVYLALSIPLLISFGLKGFSIGILISSIVKLVFVVITYYLGKNIKNNKLNKINKEK